MKRFGNGTGVFIGLFQRRSREFGIRRRDPRKSARGAGVFRDLADRRGDGLNAMALRRGLKWTRGDSSLRGGNGLGGRSAAPGGVNDAARLVFAR